MHRRGKIFIDMPASITFAFDRYDIQPRLFPAVNAGGRRISRFPAAYLGVVSHTNAIGAWSKIRTRPSAAASVADLLVRDNAKPDRIHVEGRGKTEPVASNDTTEGGAADRRVEIVLTPFEGSP